jgi:hypothetical protein
MPSPQPSIRVFSGTSDLPTAGRTVLGLLPDSLSKIQQAGSWPVSLDGILLLHRAKLAATRKPRLLFRLSGVFLLRLADRQFCALLFQLPPRFTRLVPSLATIHYRKQHSAATKRKRNAG